MAIGDVVSGFTGGLTGKEEAARREAEERERCIANGGEWINGQCIINRPEPETEQTTQQQELGIGAPETFKSSETGRASGIVIPGKPGEEDRTFLGLSPEEVALVAQGEQERVAQPEGTVPVGTQRTIEKQIQEGQVLAQQVGQFSPTGQLQPTELDFERALTEGVRNSIPRALSLAVALGGTAAASGAAGTAPIAGVGAVPAGIIGAASGFAGGISSGILSNMKGQRVDNTNAQKRVLDEGKQNLNDWVTLAKTDPSNRAFYLSQFNNQLSLINEAYQQMKTDTIGDIAKFESSVPDLAEFEAFYAVGGERDFVSDEMRAALVTPATPEFQTLEMANRRGALDDGR